MVTGFALFRLFMSSCLTRSYTKEIDSIFDNVLRIIGYKKFMNGSVPFLIEYTDILKK